VNDSPTWYRDVAKLGGYRKAVRDMMLDGGWHSTTEFQAVGGANGTRRLRELKEFGYGYETRRKADSEEFEYRLSGGPDFVRPEVSA
jgi:hypothetical protein